MGLLDDAIRDHLELKRRRGADPGEVARAQRDALDPVFPGGAPRADGDPAAGGHTERADAADADGVVGSSAEESSDGAADSPAVQAPTGADSSRLGQETVELDMQSVLDEDHEAPPPPLPGQDSLEWEVPGEAAAPSRDSAEDADRDEEQMSELPGDVPGQERMSFE